MPLRSAVTPRPAQLYQGSFGDRFEALHARSVDPAPVTIAQAFSRRPLLASAGCGWPGLPDVSYATRTHAQVDRRCGAAVWGAALKRALLRADCSQVLRAAYRTNVGRYVGLMALLNLRDSAGASHVVSLLAPALMGATDTGVGRRGFLLPLDRPAWLAVLGQGYSEASAYVAGHYVLVTWVARADGRQPSDDFWNLGRLSDLLSLPSAFAARGRHVPPVVVHIYVRRGHPSRCVMPAHVPRYSSLDLVITGNTRVSYDVPLVPGGTSGGQESTVSLGSLGRGVHLDYRQQPHGVLAAWPVRLSRHVRSAGTVRACRPLTRSWPGYDWASRALRCRNWPYRPAACSRARIWRGVRPW
ncbi:MAG: hypothetical protein ACRDPO_06025 [Streptosporangiaceae bacterium]